MRRPSVGRLIALLLGATVVLLLTIDTTMACRFFLRHRACDPCPAVAACPAPPSSCCAVESVVSYDSGCCGDVVEEPACCGGEVVTESSCCGGAVETVVDPGCGAPCGGDAGVITEEPLTDSTPKAQPTPAPVVTPAPEQPAPTPPTVVEEPAVEEPAVEEPAVDEPTVVEEAPLDDEPVMDEPAEAEEPAFDDLDAPADEPALEENVPADDLPADEGDLFDDPAGVEEPADAFSEPADALPADEAPADNALPGFDEPAAPADDAIPADPPANGDDLDDLFGGADPAANAEPRTANATEAAPAADDLFGESVDPAPATETTPAGDDLFDAPAEAPAQDAPAGDNNTVEDLDDLFGSVQPTPAPTTQPVTTPAVDDLEFRVWTDNTGNYQTVGRLVKVSPTHVRLLKDNGKFTTVDKTRLSQADLAYVEQKVQVLGIELFDQLARR